MNELPNDKLQALQTYPALYLWIVAGASLIYVIVSFGLSGIPGVSRLALYSAVLLFILLILYVGELKLPNWLFILLLFYLYLAIPAISLENISFDRLGQLIAALIGTLSIGLALQNKILSYKILVYGAITAAITNIVAVYFGVNVVPVVLEGRYAGFESNPNALAMNMAFAAFLIWLYPEHFSRMVRLLGIFLALYGTYITGSRKGVLLVAALLIMVFLSHIMKLGKVKIIAYITAITAFVLVSYEAVTGIAAKYMTKILALNRIWEAFAGHDKSFENRQSMIDIGLELWKESPLFGYGFDQYASISNVGVYSHSNYVELAVSGGLIALMLFYSLHVTILRNAMKQAHDLRLRIIIFLAVLVIMDTAVVSFYDKGVMCMIGVLLAVSSHKSTTDE